MPWPQPGVWEGPSSLGVRAANSLYWLDATADEGAAGRPEVQEGQAGRSGQSGLATGTENRKEMNRVKIGREWGRAKQWGGGQRQAGKEVTGGGQRPLGVHPLWGTGRPQNGGLRQQMLLGERKGMEGGEGSLALGEVKGGGPAKATVKRREQRTGEKGSPRAARPGHGDPFGLRTPTWLPGKLRPAEHLRATSHPEAGGEG